MRMLIKKPSGPVTGVIDLPASKSISNRALIIQALCGKEKPVIRNLSDAEDTRLLMRILENPTYEIDCMNAGTVMRFLCAYFAATPGEHILTGSPRMQERPVEDLVNALRLLGAEITYTGKWGFPPLHIKGKELSGKHVSIKGNLSSQFVSALLLIAPLLKDGVTVHLAGAVVSMPYIALTLALMKRFGINSYWRENAIKVFPGVYNPIEFSVEKDWSSASFWYEIAAFSPGSQLFLKDLRKESLQGDRYISFHMESFGVKTNYSPEGAALTSSGKYQKITDCILKNMPDLVPVLATTAAGLNSSMAIRGIQTLVHKESNRTEALKQELVKAGVEVALQDDVLRILPGTFSPNGVLEFNTYDDHRIAMALAPLSLIYGEVIVNDPAVVIKSYPSFWKDLEIAGFGVQQLN